MNLQDLFVSHKQVQPVDMDFKPIHSDDDIYLNFDRAKKAVSENSEDMSTWVVGNSDEDEPYDWKVGIQKKEQTMTQNKKQGRKIADARKSPGYANFKMELDEFINKNPQYASIKDGLEYLAALESSYTMNVENKQGSSALGWFQFMDDTRHTYNNQSRDEFANDSQAQLLAAAKHYKHLQKQISNWGGNPDDFVTVYGAWWRPESAKQHIKDPNYDYSTKYGESLSAIHKRAQDLLS